MSDEPTTDNSEDAVVTTTETEPDGSVLSQTVDVPYFNQHDGTTGRLPGVYLDEVERLQAEELRAVSEGRDPDLEHPGASAGTPLVTEDNLPDNSITKRDVIDPDAPVVPDPMQVLPVDQTGNLPDSPEAANGNVDPTTNDYSSAEQVAAEVAITGDNVPPVGIPSDNDAAQSAASTPPSITGAAASAGTFNPTTPMVNNALVNSDPSNSGDSSTSWNDSETTVDSVPAEVDPAATTDAESNGA